MTHEFEQVWGGIWGPIETPIQRKNPYMKSPNEHPGIITSAIAKQMLIHAGDMEAVKFAVSPDNHHRNGLGWLAPHVEKGFASPISGQNGFLVEAGRDGFLKTLANSWLDAITATRAPSNIPILISETDHTGIIAEKAKIPVLTSMERVELSPYKTGGLSVYSRDFLRLPMAESFITRTLRNGLTKCTNLAAIEALQLDASTASTTSTGSTPTALLNDINTATADFDLDADSAIYVLVTPQDCKSIALMKDTGGLPAFPNCGILGGELVPGINVIACPGFPEDDSNGGRAIVIDSGGLLTDRGDLFLSATDQADLEMIDPDGAAETLPISLFQTDDLALKYIRTFAIEPFRNAVAVIEGLEL